jgi:hypothetical protein
VAFSRKRCKPMGHMDSISEKPWTINFHIWEFEREIICPLLANSQKATAASWKIIQHTNWLVDGAH